MTKIIPMAAGLCYHGWQTRAQSIGKVCMNGTQSTKRITADSLVQEVVESHPQTIMIFARHGLNCVGCSISPFHTVADSAREYALALEPLLGDLNQVIVAGLDDVGAV
jgi:hybrid cluster-associated redox disulfide protein